MYSIISYNVSHNIIFNFRLHLCVVLFSIRSGVHANIWEILSFSNRVSRLNSGLREMTTIIIAFVCFRLHHPQPIVSREGMADRANQRAADGVTRARSGLDDRSRSSRVPVHVWIRSFCGGSEGICRDLAARTGAERRVCVGVCAVWVSAACVRAPELFITEDVRSDSDVPLVVGKVIHRTRRAHTHTHPREYTMHRVCCARS